MTLHQNGPVQEQPSPTDAGAAAGDPAGLRRAAWRRIRPAGPVVTLDSGLSGWDAGSDAASAAIDEGAGALLVIAATPPSTVARAIAALYCGGDASSVIPQLGSDLAWMRTCAGVRDSMALLRPLLGDASALLAHDPGLAAITASVVRAAARRTPVVIVGVTATIAALCAQRVTAASSAWVFAAVGDDDPAAGLARKRLGVTPWCTFDWTPDATTAEQVARLLVEDLDGAAGPDGD